MAEALEKKVNKKYTAVVTDMLYTNLQDLNEGKQQGPDVTLYMYWSRGMFKIKRVSNG